MIENADKLIFADWVIPVVPRGEVLQDYAVAIQAERIVAVLPAAEARGISAT